MATLIMKTSDGHWYPIEAAGKKPLKEEAADHGKYNDHISAVEDMQGNVLWQRVNAIGKIH